MSNDRTTASTHGEPFQDTLDEHHDCMQFVAELEKILDQPPDDEGRWVARLMEHLPGLSAAMREHFEAEEKSALFTELPRRIPAAGDRLEKLKEEHPRLVREIERIIEIAENVKEPEKYELREMKARVHLFVARMRRHEATENELVMEAYWEDVGTGD